MTQVKLTKNELRNQQEKLQQLQRYLPTLQLKKAMLQAEVLHAVFEMRNLQKELDELQNIIEPAKALLEKEGGKQIAQATTVAEITRTQESIAGVEVPIFGSVTFQTSEY
ncbi:MAG: V-type ATP synthase subunit D, partial [Simkaniaceae bacterium]|nr:V-type ATP synthase subunit D [Simkaniaceae bacterium]